MTPNETGSTPRSTFDRRTFMRGSLAAAALVPLGGALASCASSGTGTGTGRRGDHRSRLGQQPLWPRRQLDHRRGDLQRRLRLRLRDLRGGHRQEEPPDGHAQRHPVHADRAAAAAPLRRRQPARPHRQLRRGLDRVQHDHRPALDAGRRPRGQQPRGHQDRVHPVRRRQGPRHLQREVPRPQLRPHPVRRLVLAEPVRRERLDRAEDVGRGQGPRCQGQGEGQVPVRLGQGGGDLLQHARHRLRHQGGRPRGAHCAGEPRPEVLVAAGHPVRLRRDGRVRQERLLRPRRRRAPSSPQPRPSGATTSRRCSTPRARGSRTR